MSDTQDFPEAQAAAQPTGVHRWWWIPLLALLGAGWLVANQLSARGIEITVDFPLGHGIKIGDALRYRGIQVGQVTRIGLNSNMNGVRVSLRLPPDTADLARSGSRFWIVRPRLDLTGAEGLETVVGARYLAVIPGDGSPNREFQGLDNAPRITDPNALPIVLEATGRGHLQVGAPVSYRQVTVGSVEQVVLAPDASHVQAELAIHPDYVGLIRDNTRFWRTSGARLGADLGGLFVDVDSLQSLILGGIALAVPTQPGPLAQPRQRFVLANEPEAEWLDWQPSLQPAGPTPLIDPPVLIPLTRRWRQDNALGLSRQRQRQGWGLALPGGLLAPADLFGPAGDAIEAPQLLAGEQPLAMAEARNLSPELSYLAFPNPSWSAWKLAQTRPMETPEDLLLVSSETAMPVFIAAYRLSADGSGWRLDRHLAPAHNWHGAAALATRDARLIAILVVDDNDYRLIPFPALP